MHYRLYEMRCKTKMKLFHSMTVDEAKKLYALIEDEITKLVHKKRTREITDTAQMLGNMRRDIIENTNNLTKDYKGDV